MDEVDVDAIDGGAKLLEGVQPALLRTPVELVSPIGQQLSEILQVGSLVPRRAWALVRPACEPQTPVQVVQGVLSKIDREGLDTHGRALLPMFCKKVSLFPPV